MIHRGRAPGGLDQQWPGRPDSDGGGSDPPEVLVPYNGTEVAETALDVAAHLAAGQSAMIWILYVRPWDVTRARTRFCLETSEEAHRCSRGAAIRLRRRGISASAVMRDAPREKVASVIAAEAERLNVGCIVLGTHGHGPLLSVLNGSVTRKVAQRATRPVIQVRCRPA
jgi:nucleotide-binding universal stress UspA family protein